MVHDNSFWSAKDRHQQKCCPVKRQEHVENDGFHTCIKLHNVIKTRVFTHVFFFHIRRLINIIDLLNNVVFGLYNMWYEYINVLIMIYCLDSSVFAEWAEQGLNGLYSLFPRVIAVILYCWQKLLSSLNTEEFKNGVTVLSLPIQAGSVCVRMCVRIRSFVRACGGYVCVSVAVCVCVCGSVCVRACVCLSCIIPMTIKCFLYFKRRTIKNQCVL